MMRPDSVTELRDAVVAEDRLWICGLDTKRSFRAEPASGVAKLSLAGLSGMIAIEPEDQVAIVRAGTPISEVQAALAEKGQCLPIREWSQVGDASWCVAGMPGTIGGWLAMDLPHAWPDHGPRRVLIGATVMRPDGSLAKSGSRVVKSVAGYDVHKFLVGTRGTLALFVEVTIQTLPLGSGPGCVSVIVDREPESIGAVVAVGDRPVRAESCANVFAAAPDLGIFWFDGVPPVGDRDRTVATAPVGKGRAAWPGGCRLPEQEWQLMRRTKAIFDPQNKFNRGEFGL